MSHLTPDELILHYYGESGQATTQHLAACAQCRAEFAELRQVLSVIRPPQTPARAADYGASVWHNLRPHLPERAAAQPWWKMPRRWAVVGAMAALLIAAFLAGRFAGRGPAPAPAPTQASTAAPQRVLLVALGDHLDKSEMLLVEVAHASSPDDLAAERARAGELIASNRLYRQTALRVGDTATVAVLDDLERVLLELAHQPESSTPADLRELRRQIESGGLLFKVRVVQLNVKDEVKDSSAVNPAQSRPTI